MSALASDTELTLTPSPSEVADRIPDDPPPSNYIPVPSSALESQLRERLVQLGSDEALLELFRKLNKRLGRRCSLRMYDCFASTEDDYSKLDPDVPQHISEGLESVRTHAAVQALRQQLASIADMAGFKPVPEELFEAASQMAGARGLHIVLPTVDDLTYKLYYQRLVPGQMKVPKWHRLSNTTIATKTYDMILLTYQVHRKHIRLTTWAWLRIKASQLRNLFGARQSAPVAAAEMAPELPPASKTQPPLHLKLFANVPIQDVDMLFPGSKVKFSIIDQLFIWVPFLIGVITAIVKISGSSLKFDSANLLTSLALIVAPLGYAWRARVALKEKEDDYKADIGEIVLSQQRSSNQGALDALLDLASEQEHKELLLAYFFMWGARKVPLEMSRAEALSKVDAAIEKFLLAQILRAEMIKNAAFTAAVEDAPGTLNSSHKENVGTQQTAATHTATIPAYTANTAGTTSLLLPQPAAAAAAAGAWEGQPEPSVKAALHVDFDMTDALSDLVRIGLIREDLAKGTVCAEPLERAVEIASVRNYPEDAREVPPTVASHSDEFEWIEQFGQLSTGQIVKLYKNMKTGQTTYKKPHRYKPASTSTEVDMGTTESEALPAPAVVAPVTAAVATPAPEEPVQGARRALLAGCNYPGSSAELSGCVNDVHNIKAMLMRYYGFKEYDIECLIDTDPDGAQPTGTNIKERLRALVAVSRPGDVVVFHFSGHGTQVPDQGEADEADGKDEALVPCDHNLIYDDDLREIFCDLAKGVKLTMIADCCHSGSMLDHQEVVISGEKGRDKDARQARGIADMQDDELKARLQKGDRKVKALSEQAFCAVYNESHAAEMQPGKIKATLAQDFGNDASNKVQQKAADRYMSKHTGILITGCQSHEYSADVSGIGGKNYGALTNALIATIEAAQRGADPGSLTYRELVLDVRDALHRSDFEQNPCLECSNANADVRVFLYGDADAALLEAGDDDDELGSETGPAGTAGVDAPDAADAIEPADALADAPVVSHEPPPAQASGAHRALLVGCNYPGSSHALRGCVNDALNIKKLLTEAFNFQESDVELLLDTEKDGPQPTGANIKASLQRLVAQSKTGDCLVFHFSGHGTQVPDKGEDGEVEEDGKDEAIVPTDLNLIYDDDLRDIFSKLPEGVKLTMIADCCHSGTMLDHEEVQIAGDKARDDRPSAGGDPHLPRTAAEPADDDADGKPSTSALEAEGTQRNRALTEPEFCELFNELHASGAATVEHIHPGTIKPTLAQVFGEDATVKKTRQAPMKGFLSKETGILITGCHSHETSADVMASTGTCYGALTNALVTATRSAIDRGVIGSYTYRSLVRDVRKTLHKSGFSQNPCLECSLNNADQPVFVLRNESAPENQPAGGVTAATPVGQVGPGGSRLSPFKMCTACTS